MSALGIAGGHLAELQLDAAFACNECAEAFAADALPRMRGLQWLDIQLGRAGEDASRAIGKEAARLPVLRKLSLTFPHDTLPYWERLRPARSRAGAAPQGDASCNAVVALAMLPLLADAPALEKLSLSHAGLTLEHQAAIVPYVLAMPRLQELHGVLQNQQWRRRHLPHLARYKHDA
jgi:hypothetical protein